LILPTSTKKDNAVSYEARLKELKLEMPENARTLGMYKFVLVQDGLAYVSGHGPVGADGTSICGRLGDTLQKEDGYEAGRRTAINVVRSLREQFGSLDAIERIVKTIGFVNATPDFKDHPAVINGFSELIRDIFGPDAGVGARSAIGVASLPGGWAVEVEAVFKLAIK
jgi:enamine deaminase RidA (YjgF/YER057c/UK114 family)